MIKTQMRTYLQVKLLPLKYSWNLLLSPLATMRKCRMCFLKRRRSLKSPNRKSTLKNLFSI
jgi:hypothetical protein